MAMTNTSPHKCGTMSVKTMTASPLGIAWAPYCAHAIPRGLAVIVFTDIVPHLCGEVLVIAMLFEHGDGSVERQDGRSKERNRCLVGWAAGLPRTPCFHVRREFM